jgi:hypothetical protein
VRQSTRGEIRKAGFVTEKITCWSRPLGNPLGSWVEQATGLQPQCLAAALHIVI